MVNNFGHDLLCLCYGFDLTILNGSITGDMEGNFTYISSAGSSVIDYFLVSNDFVSQCQSLVIKDNALTAHLCLELSVKGSVVCPTFESLVTSRIV